MSKTNISILLITKNESAHLPKWKTWLPKLTNVSEIVVVDDNSTDDTIKIVKSFATQKIKVKVYTRDLANDFASQRNFGLSKTTNNLILWLDADEEPSNKLIEFLNHIGIGQYINYAFRRTDFFLGHQLKHGETASQHFLRLFDKRQGKFKGPVHETWVSRLHTQNLDLEIIHHSHQNLKTFLEKINLYTTIRSQELYDSHISTNISQIIFYPIGKFIHNYIIRLGFLDGTPGIVLALSMSFHSFLVRSKLWCLLNR